jgi:hypothetical protein
MQYNLQCCLLFISSTLYSFDINCLSFCVTELGRGPRPPLGIYSRIVNKASNLILVPFGPLAEWLKLFTPLVVALGQCLVTFCIICLAVKGLKERGV